MIQLAIQADSTAGKLQSYPMNQECRRHYRYMSTNS